MIALIAGVLLAGSGIIAFVCGKKGNFASRIGSNGAVSALLVVLGAALWEFWKSGDLTGDWYRLPIVFVGIASALYAPDYLACHDEGRTGFFWLFYNLTLTAMLAVTAAEQKYLFLVCWELMGLCSFFLVMFELRSRQVMRAAWVYLLGCEAGGMLLMLAFSLWNRMSPELYFALLVLGFGLKAGFPVLHVWLPEAHPAAPAPVSALMSGAMIPLGFCGLFRFMPQGDQWFPVVGWTLLVLGIAGSFSGILFALGQRDVKRLLAYSSVENIGIMAMGFGIGLLGFAYDLTIVGYLALYGAAFHLFNHALLKGTLFLGAGTILCSTRTLNMDLLGGLMKKLPATGGIFTVASLGICGLPPFCGFTGEVLIYAAAFAGLAEVSGVFFGALALAVIVLAMTGGCACAAFAKTVSAVFLGEPRTLRAVNAVPEKPWNFLPLLILMIPALLIPLLPLLFPAPPDFNDWLVWHVLRGSAICALVLYALGTALILWRMRHRSCDHRVGTWDCGYAQPTPRMEYTGSAFVQPGADFFNPLLHQQKMIEKPEGFFPESSRIEIETPDYGERWAWKPLFNFFGWAAEKIHRFQSGYLHLYILVMVIALALMLAWGFFSESGVR